MFMLRKLWQELRWPFLGLLLMVTIGTLIGCWSEKDRPWTLLKAIGVLLNYGAAAGVVWVFVMTIVLLAKILSSWRQTAKTPLSIVSDGRTPLERLQEEFEAAYPGRMNKEEPPVPILPPPNDDNPYSYR